MSIFFYDYAIHDALCGRSAYPSTQNQQSLLRDAGETGAVRTVVRGTSDRHLEQVVSKHFEWTHRSGNWHFSAHGFLGSSIQAIWRRMYPIRMERQMHLHLNNWFPLLPYSIPPQTEREGTTLFHQIC